MTREPTSTDPPRLGRYVWLWLLGVAVGWFEASVVVYLRELYYPGGFRFPIVIAPARIAAVEIVREAASILLLAAAARLAGRQFLERFAAFLLLFGVWDLVYYAVLWLVLGWPESLAMWDVLFLIPVPWLGPVWAPCVVSLVLVGVGSYMYWTPDTPRHVRPLDWAVEIAAGLLIVASFVADWTAVPEVREPRPFPAWLFWLGLGLGLCWFLFRERRFRRASPQNVYFTAT